MSKVKVLMIKTASGPHGNYDAGKVFRIEHKLAKEWSKSPNPACKIIHFVDDFKHRPIPLNWINHIKFGRFKLPAPVKKAPKKYRPGGKK